MFILIEDWMMSMKKEYGIMTMIVMLNYLTWLFVTVGFISVEAYCISSVVYAIYTILIVLCGDRILAHIVKTKSFNEVEDLYNVLNYSCNNYQQKCLSSSKKFKFYFFEYEKPIAFAFGKNSIFVSSSILQLRHSQQSQICTQAVAETDSLRGLANTETILGNAVIVGAFIFLLIGKWIIYIQLWFLKIMLVMTIVLFESMIGLTKSIFFGRASQSLAGIWLLKFGMLFSVDKISDAIFLVAYSVISALLRIVSFGQISLVSLFDNSTDKILSRIWSRNEFEQFINTDYDNIISEHPSLSSDRLKLLCNIVEAHINPISRIKKLGSYYVNEPQRRIKIRRTEESRQQQRIRIRKGENGGHHED